MKPASLYALIFSTAVSGLYTLPAAAQGERVIEEVLVTARKRSETLQDVPFSIAAKTEEQLRRSGATNLQTMSDSIAGLTVQDLGPGQSQVAIRGVSAGQIVRDQPGVKEQVGVYLDDSVISLSLFTPDLDFYDVQRVEVLRGPQGTLYGSGSESGTIRYIANRPDFEAVSGSMQGSAEKIERGDFGGDVKGHINVPISDKVALRATAYTTKFAGYIDALTPDPATSQPTGKIEKDVNEGTRVGGRISVLIQPNDRLSIMPRVIYQDIDMDGFNREDQYNILANPFTTVGGTDSRVPVELDDYQQYRQLEESFEDEFLMADLQVSYDFDDVTLTSVTTYTDRDILVKRDATALTASVTGDSIGDGPATYNLDAPLYDSTEVEMITQELRLTSNNDGPTQWVAGVFYTEIDRHYAQSLPVTGYDASGGGAAPSAGPRAATDELFYSDIPYEFQQVAVFGEISHDITERLNLTVGARYFDHEEERVLTFDGAFAVQALDVPGKTGSEGVSPRVLLRYDLNDDVMLNAQVAEGFRLGGINDPLNAPLCSAADLATYGGNPDFDDEEVTNYEIGAKINLRDGLGTFNVSAFYADIKNLQATLDAGSCSSRVVFNVPEAHSAGIEFELLLRPTSNTEFTVAGSYIDAELDSTITAAGTSTILGGLKDGNELPTAPDYKLAATATRYFDVNEAWDGYLVGSWQAVGARWTQISDQAPGADSITLRQGIGGATTQANFGFDAQPDGYQLLNTRIGVRNSNWDTAFYINNLTDEKALMSLDRERGGTARLGYRVNQPRTFGISTRYEF